MPWRRLPYLEDLFGSVPHLSRKDLMALYRRVHKVHLRRGEVLIHRGDKAEALFFALSGRFSVHLDDPAHPIAEIESGVPIGEIAFFAGGTRTATVKALRDAVVLKLRRPEFEELSQLIPSLSDWVIQSLAQRLGRSIARLPSTDPIVAPRTVAVVGAGDGPLCPRFVQLLEEVFRIDAPSQFLTGESVRAALPDRPSFDDPSVTAWLNAREEKSAFVFYIADSDLSDWTRKAVRQADQVLLVGRAGSRPTVNAVEQFVQDHHGPQQQRLVILHEQRQDEVTGTEYWLEARDVHMHHHVALCDAIDVDRLRRFVDGSALGLVCCGGGSYSCLHVGLYKAFTEAGIAFDIFGGTSGGGAMAAAFARGLVAEDIDRRIDEIFIQRRSLRKLTLPHYSILDHTPFDAALRDHYSTLRVENLWRPFYAFAVNLSDATPRILRTGPLWEAVRATGSIPGLLPPFITDDGVPLVDGSILDNVSLDAMKSLKRGPNVVVNFTTPLPANFADDYNDLPDRAELLRHHLLPFTGSALPDLPTLSTTIVRSMMASQKKLANVGDLDLVLEPPLPRDVSVMDWRQHTRLMAEGFAFTADALSRLSDAGHPVVAMAQRIADSDVRFRTAAACPKTESETALQAAQDAAHERASQG
ncbi:MAG: cyclic nucleotide-binding and patatin-like phospholipase domain-containing protein [Pseudomonadota bacterium]